MNELVCKNCGANLQMDEKKDILYLVICILIFLLLRFVPVVRVLGSLAE